MNRTYSVGKQEEPPKYNVNGGSRRIGVEKKRELTLLTERTPYTVDPCHYAGATLTYTVYTENVRYSIASLFGCPARVADLLFGTVYKNSSEIYPHCLRNSAHNGRHAKKKGKLVIRTPKRISRCIRQPATH